MARKQENDKIDAPPAKQSRRPTHDDLAKGNPPRTTKGGITAPKFGSAGSGGAELEPGPERD